MAKDFTQMSDAELGACFRSRYDRLCAAHDMGLDDGPHPSERWHADTAILNEHRAATAKDEGGLGPVEIQNKAKPGGAKDDTQPELTAAGNYGNGGAEPAQDGKFERTTAGVPRFTSSDGRFVVTGDAALVANARQSNPARVRRMALAIPGYKRIR
jgi:hypothetical protein